jgi:hypothetical protein
MKIRWVIVLFPVLSVVLISVLVQEHAAKAAAPQAAKSAVAAIPGASGVSNSSASLTIPETTLAINSAQPMSQRVVHYEIDAKYDAANHTVDATEVLTYHNLTGQALDHFPFHLYQNAFQPNSTFVREAKIIGSRDTSYDKWKAKEYGSEDIKSLEVVGQGDLTSQLRFIQPDDGNKDDKTVVELPLAKAIAPGGYVQFKIAFQTKFPETQARSGWKRDFVLGGQWFPKVGVWWHGAWNCHQYHAMTEFFADFGVYDVKLTVPQYEVVGASGVKVAEANNPDNTKTVTYHGDDIHDFAWTASPRYKVKDDGVYQGQMGPVQMRILMQPAHWSQVGRHEKILKESLEHFESWYGPYPYKTITLVDPEPDSAAGGMEYPTFITGDTDWFMPEGLHLPELVVEHEFGHQYWYGMVATNEFEDAWMDEGINSYTEVKVLDSILGKNLHSESGGRYRGREGAATGRLCVGGRPRSDRAKGLRLLQRQLLRRNYLRQDGERAADAGRHHRRRHNGEGDAYLLHEISLHPPDEGGLPEDDRGSFRSEFALVLRPGHLRLAGAGLQGVEDRVVPRELVRTEKERFSERGKEYGLPLLCLDPTQGRFRHAGGSGD